MSPNSPLPIWNVLLVDDDALVRSTLRRLLRRTACHVQVAENGKVALDCLEQCRYDLAIVDVMMPIVDGIVALRVLRRLAPTLPVLLITGHPSAETAYSAYKHEAAGFLVKPFSARRFLDTITPILEGVPESRRPSFV